MREIGGFTLLGFLTRIVIYSSVIATLLMPTYYGNKQQSRNLALHNCGMIVQFPEAETIDKYGINYLYLSAFICVHRSTERSRSLRFFSPINYS